MVFFVLKGARLQSWAQPHPILYFLKNSAHLSCSISAKKIFPEKIIFDDLPPHRRQKNFGQCTIIGVQKFFGCNKRLVKKYNIQSLHILRDHVRCAPAPRYKCPHLHFYFILFCAPASHFTHPHLFHLSFSHPRSRRKVPNSAVWKGG